MPTAFITGATSGIGQASVEAFVKAGWRCVATGRRADRLAELAEKHGDAVFPLAFDIADAAARNAAIDSLPDEFAEIDLLINNAGLALGTATADKADIGQWQSMIDTNATALAMITHRLLPKLIERKGAIINISSVAAGNPYPGSNVYGATKAFVSQFSRGLRSDLHGTGVRVTFIEPGMVETEFTLVRTGGNEKAHDAVYGGAGPVTGADMAQTLLWIATLPPHLNINNLEIMPVTQSLSGYQIARD